ncbi:MAG: hypothetical protein EOO61_17770 [Hymenobacter sp.]|nr:MAG: hypothetical protein EOO61_17770 [Hymenobacter sp.]
MLAFVCFSQRLVPGFARAILPQTLQMRSDAIDFSPSFNLDKVLAASAVLAFCAILRASDTGLTGAFRAVLKAIAPTMGLVALMLLPSLATHHLRFDPLLHPGFLL